MEQNALVLDIVRQADILEMSVFEQREFASTVRHYSRCPVSFSEINKLSQEVTSILNKANTKGVLEVDPSNNLKKTGQLFWDHLLTRPVKDRLKTTIIRSLVLSLDEELVDIPWELLYDGADFLALKFNLGRLIRTKEERNIPQYRSLPGKLKMLILANPTDDLKSAYLEGNFIKNQFDKKRSHFLINFKSTQIDKFYVKKNLRDYDIVHFAGHCEYDPQKPKNSGWVLSDGIFSASDIMAMAEALPLPSLIFSNACQSGHVNRDTVDSDYQRKTYNFASSLLFSGVRHYIGTIRRIEDEASFTFSKEFYSQLIKGRTVGEAVCLARLKLIHEHGINSIFWTSYLLYGDPNFVLFRPSAKPRIVKFRREFSQYRRVVLSFAFAVFIVTMGIWLYIWLPTLNPNAYLMFAQSRKLYLAGKNQEVISICNSLIKKEPLFLAAYPLLGDVYQRLGDRDAALRCYFDYALYSEKRHAKGHLASAYIGIGWIYQAKGEYAKAFDFYNKAVNLAKDNRDKLNEAAALRKLAVWYIDRGDYDKALELLLKSSEINRSRQKSYEYRYNLACDYFDIGLVFADKDDFVTAKEFYKKSQSLFEKLKLKNELSDYYFNSGEIYLFEKQYQQALDCYMRGLDIDKAQANKPSIASDYNMIGELYVEMGDLEKAEEFFNRSVSICKEINAGPELASVYYNLGLLYKERRQRNKAKEYLRQAQELYYYLDTPLYQKIRQELLALSS